MGNVNDVVGTIGGVILAIELILLVLVLLAITAGLAIGLAWVRGQMGLVHEKIELVRSLQAKYVDRGTRAIATPVIVSTSTWRGLKAGVYRATHWSRVVEAPPSSALPVAPPDQPRTTTQSVA
jgi:hypothetical protein